MLSNPDLDAYLDWLDAEFESDNLPKMANYCNAPPEEQGPHCDDGECNHCEYGLDPEEK